MMCLLRRLHFVCIGDCFVCVSSVVVVMMMHVLCVSAVCVLGFHGPRVYSFVCVCIRSCVFPCVYKPCVKSTMMSVPYSLVMSMSRCGWVAVHVCDGDCARV